ncbi:MAG: preprotein translocase SecF subunit [Alteromonas naphthalenivorans]|jgi:preprotein translocase SecF subunit
MVKYPNINFLRYRFVTAFLSCALIGAGVFGYIKHKGFRYSVDFVGGTQVLVKFSKPVGSESLKKALAESGFKDITTREFSDVDALVRVKEFSNDVHGLGIKIKDGLEKHLGPDMQATILETNAVGPGIGSALISNSLWMVAMGLLVMLLYIAMRFWSLSYGMGAVVAIFHDALCILAVFVLLDKEISPNVVIAILTTLGYSINDTIVIFARIRENFVKEAGKTAQEIVNVSLNQTLKRTLLTSISTGLTVGSLFVYGGETLRSLSLALLVGIVVGTYSSIFIASPVMLLLRGRKS